MTTPIATGWKARVDPRPSLRRVRESLPAIVQLVLAATLAYVIARYAVGHPAPLLATTVTVSSLGLARDARPVRVLETVVGMIVGILIAEVLLVTFGSGWWQLALSLTATLLIARLLAPKPAFAIAAAIQSLIVIVMPANAPFSRLIDGLIGGAVALLVTALVPRSPLREVTRDGVRLFDAFDDALRTVTEGLRWGSAARAERGLEKARGLQSDVDRWRGTIESGLEIARISPFLHRHRFEIERQRRILHALDLASRNLRVVARRCGGIVLDGEPREEAAALLAELRRGAALLGDSLGDISLEPAALEALRTTAAHLHPTAVAGALADQNLIALMRPLAVDLMTAAGLDAREARAVLPPL